MTYSCPVSCDTCDKVRERAQQEADMMTKKKKLHGARKGGGASSTARATALSDDDRQWLTRTEEFGLRQVAEGAQAVQTMQVIRESVRYMESDDTQQLPKSILDVCENRHQFCAFWVTTGECDKNKAYMATNCAPSCKTCHLIDMEARCPKLVNPRSAFGKGGVNRMFDRIVREAPGNRTLTDDERRQLVESNMTEYAVVVHSGPGSSSSGSSSNDDVDDLTVATDKSRPPWVITFENFLTSDECDALVQLGHKYVYKRSEDVGERKFDGTHGSIQSDRRTSENAWCSDKDGCRQETVADNVHKRMSAVMGIPSNHSEDLQLLKYEIGQYYRTHHDFIPHQVERQCGPRILTFFLYLSDVEAGGGTNFPHLDLTIMPKKGRALLWPSVLNSNPIQKDGRMMHQALAVEAGTKYAANGWIHLYDYVTPQANGCN
jgi:prolyl 4-hydroxylase